MPYSVYILECADGTYYTGITNDVEKRLVAHNTSKSGAKYTRVRRPVRLAYTEECQNKGEALRREYEIKGYTRAEKARIIATFSEKGV